MKIKAFTLIELLVVIAIIAVLMAVLLPSLNMARDQAKRVHCISNVKTLTFAWLLYKDDYDGSLVGGFPARTSDAWIQGPTGNDPNPIEQKKEGIRQGKLYFYTKNVNVYQCPSDQRQMRPPQYAFGSFSVAGGMNGEEKEWSNRHLVKYIEIEHPATKYVFVEETDPRGWNKGSWVMDREGEHWIDPLAVWHSKSKSTLGWADGHVEMHQWVNESTIDMARRAAWGDTGVFNNMVPPADERDDIKFMHKGYAILPRPRK